MSDGGSSQTVDVSQTNVDPNTAVNPNPGSVDSRDYNPTTVSQWWDTQQAVGGLPNVSSFPWGQAANAILGGSGGGMGAGLALGLGALAAALSRQQAPTIKAPEYKAAPIYNRALTAPIFPPQPAPQKSASGQNIYTPLKGMPLFFNPNPFQFDPTEAAKKYGPTQEQIAKGQEGYEAGIASLYKPLSITPFTDGAATGQNQAPANPAPANPAPANQGVIDKERASSGFDINAVKVANPQLDWSKYNPNKMTMDYDDYDRAIDNFINKNNTAFQQQAPSLKTKSGTLTPQQQFLQGPGSEYVSLAGVVTPSKYFGDASGLSSGIDQAYENWYQSNYGAAPQVTHPQYASQFSNYSSGGDVYEFAKGNFLQGDGDGMSDSIPATINNKQPARLADGEFIVPADVVSDLGNGSSNAGAKKLYQMMNKIRKERHGTHKQPPQVKAERVMPK